MTILDFKNFGDLDELKNTVEYIIDDNELISEIRVYEEYIIVEVHRRDANYFKKGNINCPSNQESANLVSELCEVIKQLGLNDFNVEVSFCYSIDKKFKSMDGNMYNISKIDSLNIIVPNLNKVFKNIEETIKSSISKKDENIVKFGNIIVDVIITSFEIQLYFKK